MTHTENNLFSGDKFWDFVEEYGWGTKTVDYESIRESIMLRLTQEEAEALRQRFCEERSKVAEKIGKIVTGFGDDSFDDLTSHIVGMGRAVFSRCLKNPRTALKIKFVESFSYAIPNSFYYRQKENKMTDAHAG